MSVPFNDLSRRYEAHASEINAVAKRVLQSGYYVLGPEVRALEDRFAVLMNAGGAAGVNSGTDAIAIALKALGVGPDDEVITVANTCTPTVAAIRMTGAMPVFADIDRETFVIDPSDLEHRITPRTKAIVPVHLYGFPADMVRINEIALRRDLIVVEDCAQSIGATVAGSPAGSFGHAAAFSFYPTKNVGAFGDGGMIVAKDPAIAARARRIRMYGEEKRYEAVEEGMNSRLDELQAALVAWGMERIDAWNARRNEIAMRYKESIKNSAVTLPTQVQDGREGVWHLFVVRVAERTRFIEHLKKEGVGSSIHYPAPVFEQSAYSFLNEDGSTLPITKEVVSKVVSLPLFPELTDKEVGLVVDAVNSYSQTVE